MTTKPNCYTCKFRGNVPGSAHSSCDHPDADLMSAFLGENPLEIVAVRHAVASGWFIWPADFDPRWLISCKGYTEK